LDSKTTTYKLIDKIEKLSLAKFQDLVCDINLSVLIVSGEPSEIDLLECWSNLYSQYLDILGDTETMYIITLQRECEQTNTKIVITEAILNVLEFIHVQSLVDQLKSYGWDTKYLKQGHSNYSQAINKIKGRVQFLKLRMEEKSNELTNYYKGQEEQTVSRSFFSKQLARLSKFQGYPIKPNKTYVPEYVAILKEYLSQFKPQDDGSESQRKDK
jgi:hypothetical protein